MPHRTWLQGASTGLQVCLSGCAVCLTTRGCWRGPGAAPPWSGAELSGLLEARVPSSRRAGSNFGGRFLASFLARFDGPRYVDRQRPPRTQRGQPDV